MVPADNTRSKATLTADAPQHHFSDDLRAAVDSLLQYEDSSSKRIDNLNTLYGAMADDVKPLRSMADDLKSMAEKLQSIADDVKQLKLECASSIFPSPLKTEYPEVVHNLFDKMPKPTPIHVKAYNILVVGACESEDKAYKVFDEMPLPLVEEGLNQDEFDPFGKAISSMSDESPVAVLEEDADELLDEMGEWGHELIHGKADDNFVIGAQSDLEDKAHKVFVVMSETNLTENLLGIESTNAADNMLDERPKLSPVDSNAELYGNKAPLSSFPFILEFSHEDDEGNWFFGLLNNLSMFSTQYLSSEDDVSRVSLINFQSLSKLEFNPQVFDPGTCGPCSRGLFTSESGVRVHFGMSSLEHYIQRKLKIRVSASEEDSLLPGNSKSWHCIQTLELKSSAESYMEEAFFNQVRALRFWLLTDAKEDGIYAQHFNFGSYHVSTMCLATRYLLNFILVKFSFPSHLQVNVIICGDEAEFKLIFPIDPHLPILQDIPNISEFCSGIDGRCRVIIQLFMVPLDIFDVKIVSLFPCKRLRVLDNFHEARILRGQNVALIMAITFENFVWHPGLCAISFYILEDKNVFEGVGKYVVLMDTILEITKMIMILRDTVGLATWFLLKGNEASNGLWNWVVVLPIGALSYVNEAIEDGTLTAFIRALKIAGVLHFILDIPSFDGSTEENCTHDLSTMNAALLQGIGEALFLGNEVINNNGSKPFAYENFEGIKKRGGKLHDQSMELHVFDYKSSEPTLALIWDGDMRIKLVPIGVTQVDFQTFVWDPGLDCVSFRFSTLRTRCSFRGGICHDIAFYYKFYMYFRIFVFTYSARYDVMY